MKALRILVFVLGMILATSPAFAADLGGLDFVGEPYVTFDPNTTSYYMTTPEVQVGNIKGWVKWKLNFNSLSWDIVAAGLESDIHGTSTASGNYVFDSQRGVIVLDVQNTDFVGCGFSPGVQVWFISAATASTITISDPFEEGGVIATRQGGGSGILGTWSATIESNPLVITFNGDGTFTGLATIFQCLSD